MPGDLRDCRNCGHPASWHSDRASVPCVQPMRLFCEDSDFVMYGIPGTYYGAYEIPRCDKKCPGYAEEPE